MAACHGVLAALAPQTRVIDITHLVPPGDIERGSAVLAQTVPHLPPAVHVAVVDPGVGTGRRSVAVAAGESILVGPDNGLLAAAADALGGVEAVYALTNPALWRPPVSATFHGRDVFCPVAARLATGTALREVGPVVEAAALARLRLPVAHVEADRIQAQAVTIDRFGNVQLCGGPPARWAVGQRLLVEVGERHQPATYAETFAAVPIGELAVFVDSAGLVAVAVNRGRAAQRLGVSPGTTVTVRPDPTPDV